MTTRTLATAAGDLAPDFGIAVDTDAVRLRVAERLRLWLGEWYLNTLAGTPWVEDILRNEDGAPLYRQLLSDAAARVTGVAEVVAVTLEFDRATRRADIRLTIRTDYGDAVDVAV